MKRSLILLLLVFVSATLCAVVAGWVVSITFDDPTDAFSMFVSYVGTFGAVIAILWAIGRRMGYVIPSFRPRMERLNLPLILLGVICILAINVVAEPLLTAIAADDQQLNSVYEMLINGGLWSVLMAVVAAPILEEFIFRGIVQQSVTRFVNPFVGILLASLIFGLIHIIPAQVVGAFLVSMVLGAVMAMTGSLMTVVVIHLLNNGLAYIQLMYFGESSSLKDILFRSPEAYVVGYMVCCALMVGLAAVAVIRIKKRFKGNKVDKGVTNAA